MNKAKQKGDREERDVVNTLKKWGFTHSQRTLEAGARNKGAHTYDIDLIINKDDAAMIGECKMRKDGFKQIYEWIKDNDFLTIRSNNKERLYVFPERVAEVLLKGLKNK